MTEDKNRRVTSSGFTIYALPLIVLIGGSLFQSGAATANQISQTTTVILVRHAEKKVVPPENKDPDLSEAGEARAKEIARMFGGAGIGAIYASQYKRTQQTVKPLSDRLGVPVIHVEAKKTSDLVAQIRSANAGQTVFIAGHNNTVPEIIAALGGPKLPLIPETDFDNLYILTIQKDGGTKLLQIKFGNPFPVSGQSMTKP